MRRLRITIGNKSYDVTVEDVTEMDVPASTVPLPNPSSKASPAVPPNPAPAAAQPSGPVEQGSVVSPMAGAIKTIRVEPGDHVTAGQSLLILEAMKMDNEITAPITATVKSINVAVGDSVREGDLLIRLE